MLFEILLWDIVYLAVYLPVSFALKAYTGKGDAFGILLIGGMCTAVLSVILAFQEEWVFESVKPAITANEPKMPVPVQIIPLEVETHEEKEENALPAGREPEPKMCTDVDLGRLDADDDDILS
jgi:hypothetical protein